MCPYVFIFQWEGFIYTFWYSLLSTSSALEYRLQSVHYLQMTSSEGFQHNFSIILEFVCCDCYLKKSIVFTLVSATHFIASRHPTLNMHKNLPPKLQYHTVCATGAKGFEPGGCNGRGGRGARVRYLTPLHLALPSRQLQQQYCALRCKNEYFVHIHL